MKGEILRKRVTFLIVTLFAVGCFSISARAVVPTGNEGDERTMEATPEGFAEFTGERLAMTMSIDPLDPEDIWLPPPEEPVPVWPFPEIDIPLPPDTSDEHLEEIDTRMGEITEERVAYFVNKLFSSESVIEFFEDFACFVLAAFFPGVVDHYEDAGVYSVKNPFQAHEDRGD